jgi:hypothetical protein
MIRAEGAAAAGKQPGAATAALRQHVYAASEAEARELAAAEQGAPAVPPAYHTRRNLVSGHIRQAVRRIGG